MRNKGHFKQNSKTPTINVCLSALYSNLASDPILFQLKNKVVKVKISLSLLTAV